MSVLNDNYSSVIRHRLVVVSLFCFFLFLFVIGRLFFVQVFRHSFYRRLADDNRIVLLPISPQRGKIYDRNGVVLAGVVPRYTIDADASYIKKNPDFIDKFSLFFPMSPEEKKSLFSLVRSFSPQGRRFVTLKNHLTDEDLAKFSAYRFLFPYARLGSHFFRFYPHGPLASHLIGYMGRIDERDWKSLQERGESGNYRGTNFLGRQGIEKQYESYLHGTTGYSASEATATGQIVRHLGLRKPLPGSNIYLTIDFSLQALAESLLLRRRGVILAFDPRTGEVLAFVSAPNIDPNLFASGIGSAAWKSYLKSANRPLINRATESLYPPGSTYKPYMALAGLMLNYRTSTQRIHDDGYFILGKHKFRDDVPGGHGPLNISDAISVSCDVYFFQLAYEMGPDVIHDFNKRFGFGEKTGIDLPYEVSGVLPSRAWKKARVHQRWYVGDSVSLGVGQGYNLFTPIQVAQALQVLANRGQMMQLHVTREIRNPSSQSPVFFRPRLRRRVSLDPVFLDVVIHAMSRVCTDGTARNVFKNVPYTVAGKTGTAQVVDMKNHKYDPSLIDEFKRDHSWFIAFSPVKNPRIAVVVLVENGGWGAEAAAPLAKKMIDFYFSHRDSNNRLNGVGDGHFET